MTPGKLFNLSPEYPILGLLAQQPAHGYELHQRLESELGQIWRVSLSQVYNILNRLENRGLIHGKTEPQERLPDRRLFHLTDSGRSHLEAWLMAPCGSSVKAVRVDFLTRLYFARQRDARLTAELVAGQTAVIRQGLERLQAERQAAVEPGTINILGLDLRIRQLNSVLSWLENIAQRLEDPENHKVNTLLIAE